VLSLLLWYGTMEIKLILSREGDLEELAI
jgi:hypothetical protein